MRLTFGSLFAGIGGADLGAERAGMECRWQVEIDDFCNRVLARHWPNVRRWRDVRTFPPRSFEHSYSWRAAPTRPFAPDMRRDTTRAQWGVDVIWGGFPCQDISNAGHRAGIDGERSGLWSEMLRVIGVLRPGHVVVENVAAILGRGLGRVVGDLAAIGYDAEWAIVPAEVFGAGHERERLFVVSYPAGSGSQGRTQTVTVNGEASCKRHCQPARVFAGAISERGRWETEADILRVGYGLPDWVDRIRSCGNAIVPQVAEWIGRRIVAASGVQK